jgi:hypothetical protein
MILILAKAAIVVAGAGLGGRLRVAATRRTVEKDDVA